MSTNPLSDFNLEAMKGCIGLGIAALVLAFAAGAALVYFIR